MQILLVSFMLLLNALIVSASSNIIITEILYDPLNETGGEAIELYNPTNSSIDIGGWVIATESSSTDATIHSGTVMQPGSYYLIADAGWSLMMPSYPADHEEALTLSNIDAGVALVYNESFIDAVGWGNASRIDPGLFEGNPAERSSEGQSIQRRKINGLFQDTNNNSADFYSSSPDLKNSSYGNSMSEISVYVHVLDSTIYAERINLTEDDDSTSAGSQIMPFPGRNRTISIQSIIHGSANVTVMVNSGRYAMKRLMAINSSAGLYEANISIPFYMAPGNHTLSIFEEGRNSTLGSIGIEILPVLSMDIDTRELSFAAPAGEYSELVGDSDASTTDMATLRNTGNTNVNIELSGTDLAFNSNNIDIENLRYSFGSISGAMSSSRQRISIGIPAGSSSLLPLTFRLDIPSGAVSGNYSGKLFIGAVS